MSETKPSYYQRNKERLKAEAKAYYQKHKEYRKEQSRLKYLRKKSGEPAPPKQPKKPNYIADEWTLIEESLKDLPELPEETNE
jgi:hypothetical protein